MATTSATTIPALATAAGTVATAISSLASALSNHAAAIAAVKTSATTDLGANGTPSRVTSLMASSVERQNAAILAALRASFVGHPLYSQVIAHLAPLDDQASVATAASADQAAGVALAQSWGI